MGAWVYTRSTITCNCANTLPPTFSSSFFFRHFSLSLLPNQRQISACKEQVMQWVSTGQLKLRQRRTIYWRVRVATIAWTGPQPPTKAKWHAVLEGIPEQCSCACTTIAGRNTGPYFSLSAIPSSSAFRLAYPANNLIPVFRMNSFRCERPIAHRRDNQKSKKERNVVL